MKILNIFIATLVMVLISACGGKSTDKAGSGEQEISLKDSVDARGVQSMQESKSEVTIDFKGQSYSSMVYRRPDDGLPHVKNEMGDTYMDNKISVRLMSGTTEIFSRTFTKSDFSAVVDSDFLSKSILEGIVFDKTSPDGFVFAASVCYPQTDLYMPLSITITKDGKTTIRKVEVLEESLSEGASE